MQEISILFIHIGLDLFGKYTSKCYIYQLILPSIPTNKILQTADNFFHVPHSLRQGTSIFKVISERPVILVNF
jgi:hypothetical protein